ncbi:hypothetical protein [Hydromonas duriensis]|uniref:Uncharacterized protein n=1 Tax=Hydromonas duriensis TaxID=1527608 RepID=A0A4R6Y692_9BURK|nr:hypothetical protein [Hydromonas duriensis]TDR30303.1 hypothetical protein DFR44_12327 [Hydromonas duriensis]
MQQINQNQSNSNPTSKPFPLASEQLSKTNQTANERKDWYLESTPKERIELVNNLLAGYGWGLKTSEGLDSVVTNVCKDKVVTAYFYPDSSYRWFSAFVDGVEICSADFRGLNPDNVDAYYQDFRLQILKAMDA